MDIFWRGQATYPNVVGMHQVCIEQRANTQTLPLLWGLGISPLLFAFHCCCAVNTWTSLWGAGEHCASRGDTCMGKFFRENWKLSPLSPRNKHFSVGWLHVVLQEVWGMRMELFSSLNTLHEMDAACYSAAGRWAPKKVLHFCPKSFACSEKLLLRTAPPRYGSVGRRKGYLCKRARDKNGAERE